MKMRYNHLFCIYCILLTVAVISSSFLLLVVANENTISKKSLTENVDKEMKPTGDFRTDDEEAIQNTRNDFRSGICSDSEDLSVDLHINLNHNSRLPLEKDNSIDSVADDENKYNSFYITYNNKNNNLNKLDTVQNNLNPKSLNLISSKTLSNQNGKLLNKNSEPNFLSRDNLSDNKLNKDYVTSDSNTPSKYSSKTKLKTRTSLSSTSTTATTSTIPATSSSVATWMEISLTNYLKVMNKNVNNKHDLKLYEFDKKRIHESHRAPLNPKHKEGYEKTCEKGSCKKWDVDNIKDCVNSFINNDNKELKNQNLRNQPNKNQNKQNQRYQHLYEEEEKAVENSLLDDLIHQEISTREGLPEVIASIATASVPQIPIDMFESLQKKFGTSNIKDFPEAHGSSSNESYKHYSAKDEKTEKINVLASEQEESIHGHPQDHNLVQNALNNAPRINENENETATLLLPKIEEPQNNDSVTCLDLRGINKKQEKTDQNPYKENMTKRVNFTTQEIPIPVFSEWAQKQMEAVEKQQAIQQEQFIVNCSSNRHNQTNVNGKVAQTKTHAKNYAGPDCGAKIIASNPDALNIGAVLNSSPDEYMLNPCGKQNWFVVELCEAIQAQKIRMANFELFSSTPKNFSVSVSNRYPTREWSNVGRFIAEDKRELQSFDLFPHLYGKFVRVDIYSHYAKEHFCPISLFHVYGTSEFEAFETEDHPNYDLDDFDDELSNTEQGGKNKANNNLFKSASDAVLSIVKKAAEVLVKPATTKESESSKELLCLTPLYPQFTHSKCNRSLVEKINNVLSCHSVILYNLFKIRQVQYELINSQVCMHELNIDVKSTQFQVNKADCSNQGVINNKSNLHKSYFLNILPLAYVGALCYLVAFENIRLAPKHQIQDGIQGINCEQLLNYTMGKKGAENFNLKENQEKLLKKVTSPLEKTTSFVSSVATISNEDRVNEKYNDEPYNILRLEAEHTPPQNQEDKVAKPDVHQEDSESISAGKSSQEQFIPFVTMNNFSSGKLDSDINIFNVPDIRASTDETLQPNPLLIKNKSEILGSLLVANGENINENNLTLFLSTSASTMETGSYQETVNIEDSTSWEMENLLTSTIPTSSNPALSASNGATIPVTPQNDQNHVQKNGNNNQQKLLSNRPQSESIFIRLSNRIKALERNMSLSGQYLEELSRRYKKQVEDLTTVLGQQMQAVRVLENHNRQHLEIESTLQMRCENFRKEIDELKLQLNGCVMITLFFGGILLVVLIFILGTYYLKYKRVIKSIKLLAIEKLNDRRLESTTNKNQALMKKSILSMNQKRRKSFESLSDQQKGKHIGSIKKKTFKSRRPSEEASIIINESAVCKKDLIIKQYQANYHSTKKNAANDNRQRKVSIIHTNEEKRYINSIVLLHDKENNKRVAANRTWPFTGQENAFEGLNQKGDAYNGKLLKASNLHKKCNNSKDKCIESKKRQLRKLVSDPVCNNNGKNQGLSVEGKRPIQLSYGIKDNCNDFDNVKELSLGKIKLAKKNKKKLKFLLSPILLKTPLSKILKLNRSGTNPPHEATSWDWYSLSKKNITEESMKELTIKGQTNHSDSIESASSTDSTSAYDTSDFSLKKTNHEIGLTDSETAFKSLTNVQLENGDLVKCLMSNNLEKHFQTNDTRYSNSPSSCSNTSSTERSVHAYNSSYSQISSISSGSSALNSSRSDPSTLFSTKKKDRISIDRLFRKFME